MVVIVRYVVSSRPPWFLDRKSSVALCCFSAALKGWTCCTPSGSALRSSKRRCVSAAYRAIEVLSQFKFAAREPPLKTTFNQLKNTPTPNKNSSYGIKVGVRMAQKSEFVCHKSRFVHLFLCESPFISGEFYAIRPSFYGIFWEHTFASMGGGGGQTCLHTLAKMTETLGSHCSSDALCLQEMTRLTSVLIFWVCRLVGNSSPAPFSSAPAQGKQQRQQELKWTSDATSSRR